MGNLPDIYIGHGSDRILPLAIGNAVRAQKDVFPLPGRAAAARRFKVLSDGEML
jgi:hypothetical protein